MPEPTLISVLRDVGNFVYYYPKFIKITGSLESTIFLCYLINWSRATTDDDYWIYKTRGEIEEETGLRRSQQEDARKRLVMRGFLEEARRGVPAKMYFRINERIVQNAWNNKSGKLPDITIYDKKLNEISLNLRCRADHINKTHNLNLIDLSSVFIARNGKCYYCHNPIENGPGNHENDLRFIYKDVPYEYTEENIEMCHVGCQKACIMSS